MSLVPLRPSIRALVIATFVGLVVLMSAIGAHGATRGQGAVPCTVSGPQWRSSADANATVGTVYLVRISIKSLDVKLRYSCAQAKAAVKKLFLHYPHLNYPQAYGNGPVRLRGGPAGFVCSTGAWVPPLQDSGGRCARLAFSKDGNIGGASFFWRAFR